MLSIIIEEYFIILFFSICSFLQIMSEEKPIARCTNPTYFKFSVAISQKETGYGHVLCLAVLRNNREAITGKELREHIKNVNGSFYRLYQYTGSLPDGTFVVDVLGGFTFADLNGKRYDGPLGIRNLTMHRIGDYDEVIIPGDAVPFIHTRKYEDGKTDEFDDSDLFTRIGK